MCVVTVSDKHWCVCAKCVFFVFCMHDIYTECYTVFVMCDMHSHTPHVHERNIEITTEKSEDPQRKSGVIKHSGLPRVTRTG